MSRRIFLKSDFNRILNSEASNPSDISKNVHIPTRNSMTRLRMDQRNLNTLSPTPRRYRQGKKYTIYSGKNATFTVRLSRDTFQTKSRLESLIESMVEQFGGSEENTKIWFNSSNPELDGKTPMYFVNQGKFDIIEDLIEAIESGQPG